MTERDKRFWWQVSIDLLAVVAVILLAVLLVLQAGDLRPPAP